jgi:hypothetical protein
MCISNEPFDKSGPELYGVGVDQLIGQQMRLQKLHRNLSADIVGSRAIDQRLLQVVQKEMSLRRRSERENWVGSVPFYWRENRSSHVLLLRESLSLIGTRRVPSAVAVCKVQDGIARECRVLVSHRAFSL